MAEFAQHDDDFPWEQYMQEELAIFEAQQQINRTNTNHTTTTNNFVGDDEDGVRAPDAVIRETLLGGPSFVSNRTVVDNNSLTKEQIIEEKKRQEEENDRKRMEEIKRQTEEHWISIGEKLKPIVDLSMRLRLDDKMRLMCHNIENIIKKYLDKKSKFMYLNNEDYEIFYQFIHFIYPKDGSGRKRITQELYDFVENHFRLE